MDTSIVDGASIIEHMDDFLTAHLELRQPYAACSGCLNDSADFPCVSQERFFSNRALHQAYVRLFNVIRLNDQQSAVTQMADFVQICVRLLGSYGFKPNPYCIFVGLLEQELGLRGASLGWPFASIDHLIQLNALIFHRLYQLLDPQFPSRITPDQRITLRPMFKDLEDYSSALHEIQGSILPFPGCRSCVARCQHRYDMNAQLQADDRWLMASNPQEAFWLEEKLVPRARLAAEQSVPHLSERFQAVALCYVAQALAHLGFDTEDQKEMTSRLSQQLLHSPKES
jgi:hypothetical protein